MHTRGEFKTSKVNLCTYITMAHLEKRQSWVGMQSSLLKPDSDYRQLKQQDMEAGLTHAE